MVINTREYLGALKMRDVENATQKCSGGKCGKKFVWSMDSHNNVHVDVTEYIVCCFCAQNTTHRISINEGRWCGSIDLTAVLALLGCENEVVLESLQMCLQ